MAVLLTIKLVQMFCRSKNGLRQHKMRHMLETAVFNNVCVYIKYLLLSSNHVCRVVPINCLGLPNEYDYDMPDGEFQKLTASKGHFFHPLLILPIKSSGYLDSALFPRHVFGCLQPHSDRFQWKLSTLSSSSSPSQVGIWTAALVGPLLIC